MKLKNLFGSDLFANAFGKFRFITNRTFLYDKDLFVLKQMKRNVRMNKKLKLLDILKDPSSYLL